MKTGRLLVFVAVILWTLPLMAFLPPDAQFRKNEYIQKRVRARAEYAKQYEQQQKDNEKAAIALRIKTEADMQIPPWMRDQAIKEEAGAEEQNVVGAAPSVRSEAVQPQATGAGVENHQPQNDSGPVVVSRSTQKAGAMKKPARAHADENKLQNVAVVSPLPVEETSSQINHRFLLSVVFLFLIGIVAGWVRYKTRELDK